MTKSALRIPEELHTRLKVKAAERRMSMQMLIEEAIRSSLVAPPSTLNTTGEPSTENERKDAENSTESAAINLESLSNFEIELLRLSRSIRKSGTKKAKLFLETAVEALKLFAPEGKSEE